MRRAQKRDDAGWGVAGGPPSGPRGCSAEAGPSSAPDVPLRPLGSLESLDGSESGPGADPHRSAGEALWFSSLEAEPTTARTFPIFRVLSFALAALALVAVAVARSIVLRALLPVALMAAAIALSLRGRRRPLAPEASGRGLSLDAQRLAFHPGRGGEPGGLETAPRTVVSTKAPFGLTLVTNPGRERLVAAITSSDGVFLVGAPIDAEGRQRFAALLERATVLPNDEPLAEPLAPDGRKLELGLASLARLCDALRALDPTCPERLVLTDAKGAPVLLDVQELRAGGHRFDLTAPLEWRALVFQEPFGDAITVYQGTWVRQDDRELFLVSLLPSLGAEPLGIEGRPTGVPELDRALARGARLAQAAPESAPPPGRRIGIERLFMLPLRSALDKAPRSALHTPPASA